MKLLLVNQTSSRLDRLAIQSSNRVAETSAKIDDNIRTTIAQRFAQPVIEATFSNAVKLEAQALLESQVQPAVLQLSNKISAELARAEDLVTASKASFERVSHFAEVSQLVQRTMMYDRVAFDALKEIEDSTNAPLNDFAYRARFHVVQMVELTKHESLGSGLIITTNLFDPDTAAFDTYRALYKVQYAPVQRSVLLSYL